MGIISLMAKIILGIVMIYFIISFPIYAIVIGVIVAIGYTLWYYNEKDKRTLHRTGNY